MAKWKYTEDQNTNTGKDLFIKLKANEETKLEISEWEFLKGHHSGAMFKCSVSQENDIPVDKFWYIWDFELKEDLKAGLKGKKISQKISITVTRETDEDEVEEEFKLIFN